MLQVNKYGDRPKLFAAIEKSDPFSNSQLIVGLQGFLDSADYRIFCFPYVNIKNCYKYTGIYKDIKFKNNYIFPVGTSQKSISFIDIRLGRLKYVTLSNLKTVIVSSVLGITTESSPFSIENTTSQTENSFFVIQLTPTSLHFFKIVTQKVKKDYVSAKILRNFSTSIINLNNLTSFYIVPITDNTFYLICSGTSKILFVDLKNKDFELVVFDGIFPKISFASYDEGILTLVAAGNINSLIPIPRIKTKSLPECHSFRNLNIMPKISSSKITFLKSHKNDEVDVIYLKEDDTLCFATVPYNKPELNKNMYQIATLQDLTENNSKINLESAYKKLIQNTGIFNSEEVNKLFIRPKHIETLVKKYGIRPEQITKKKIELSLTEDEHHIFSEVNGNEFAKIPKKEWKKAFEDKEKISIVLNNNNPLLYLLRNTYSKTKSISGDLLRV